MIAAVKRKEENKNKARANDMISFKYKGISCEGIVKAIYLNSVCVEITKSVNPPKEIEIPDSTIINYKRYKIL